MSLTGEAVKYLQDKYPNSAMLGSIILQDDGEGPYIRYWGIGSPKPTEEEINIAAQSMIPKPKKPTVEESLELLYFDQKNGTKTYSEAVDLANDQ